MKMTAWFTAFALLYLGALCFACAGEIGGNVPDIAATAAGRAAIESVESLPDDAPSTDPTSPPFLYWEDSLRYQIAPRGRLVPESIETGFRLNGSIGVRAQMDSALVDQSTVLGGFSDHWEVRRLRLSTRGEMFALTPVHYKFDLSVNRDNVVLTDAYLWFKQIPHIDTLKLGHFKAPMGLDQLTSSFNTQFMERPAPIEAFAPGRKGGVEMQKHFETHRITWALGWFADASDADIGSATDSLARVVNRTTWYRSASGDDGVFHLGLSGSYARPQEYRVRYRSRPESHLAPQFVDTGFVNADGEWGVALESAFVRGPWTLQAEYLQFWADHDSPGTMTFRGWYISGGWFLTGETRPYDPGNGTFGRVKPLKNLSFKSGGIGALEWVARFSQLDLDNASIGGGFLNVWSTGLTWYWSPKVLAKLNYIFADSDRAPISDEAHIVQSRLQFDF